MKKNLKQRGFALIIAIIFTSVILSVATALLGIAYQQLVLASAARQSVVAFYNADSALECAQEQDSSDEFDYVTGPTSGTFNCEGQSISFTTDQSTHSPNYWTTFYIPCSGGLTTVSGQTSNYNAYVTIVKASPSSGTSPLTAIYADGFSSCIANNSQRIERGEKVFY